MTTATKPVILVALVTFALLATVTPPFTSRNAGATTTTWAKTYGGAGSDIAYSVTPTSDGGYVVAGRTSSFGAGSSDAWVFKLDATGAIIWQKTYGGPAYDRAWSVQATPGGGFVVAGSTDSFGAGGTDAWVLRIDDAGAFLWQTTYGGAGTDEAYAIQAMADGGFVVGAVTGSFGAGGQDYWVLKLDSNGAVQWERTLGTAAGDTISSVSEGPGGTIIASGLVADPAATGNNPGKAWVVKLAATGSVLWERMIDTNNRQWLGWKAGHPAVATPDGGALVTGGYGCGGGFASCMKVLVLKLAPNGNIQWSKTYESLHGIAAATTSDGGYVVTGRYLRSGTWSLMVLKLDANGNAQWKRTYGGSSGGWDVRQTADGGYAVAAEISPGSGPSEAWILRLAPDGTISSSCASGIGASVSPGAKKVGLSSASRAYQIGASSAFTANSSAGPIDTAATVVTQCSA